ncbi:HpcH/HpaI aldolase/citrate lyase family protein [Propionibacterium australiense]|uniref:Citrate lyase beta subunit-like n=1 Tax=Propionibacterium australiense TaxID=119981 RepID=A0A383S6Q9_9ACTN|nr:CoA ester lyase [Propionibacterium australiense]RLP09623.1 CoA ester lyase [Propionibacterium australiense]RLP12325.1 CoA ester lyase [Propionibacterium australiense]SYZ33523.1 Citrate lyase beta subunit-like [Propionibacterium australiense]VEH89642.1 (3S)-malyl-CoA thioesterase [Propionibacterium australiense]
MSYRPRRSVLYMPASNARALAKARTIDCDAVILDLEDAVAPDAKPGARAAACEAVRSGQYGHRELVVRVNAPGTSWHEEDLAAVCAAGPDAIAVPKVDSAGQVRSLVAAMEALGAPEGTALWAMIETPRAVLDADEILGASDRLEVAVLGTNDLVNELRAAWVPGRAPLAHALQAVVCAARANGKIVLDGVYNDVRDEQGFEAECRQGLELGFDGKTLIHPGQVAIANDVWAPDEAAVAEARELIAVFDEALAAGSGVVTFGGRMVENLHVAAARRILDAHEAIRGR